MSDLHHHRHKLHVSQDEVQQLGQLLSTKDSTIRDLHASKKLVAQELEAARLAVKASEDNCAVLKAQRQGYGQSHSRWADLDEEARRSGA
jgi:uncharacterized protein YaaR (DUF327 family)